MIDPGGRYRRRDEVTWAAAEGFFVVGGGYGSGVSVANGDLVEILEKLDGSRPLREVTPHLATVEALMARGLVEDVRERPPVASPRRANADRFSHLFIEMTSRCNLRCKHCYMEGGLARPNELRLDQMVSLIDQFASLGGEFFTMSGGESLLYRNWPLLAEYAARRGLASSLMTNGTYFDQGQLDLIKRLNITVGLGLDGVTAAAHDENRGRGSFAETMKALELLLQNGYAYNTTICFTPMRSNVYDLPGIVNLMRQAGLPRLYVSLLESRGRAAYFKERLEMTAQQRKWLMHYLYDLARTSMGTLYVELTHHVEIFDRLLFDRDIQRDRHLTIRVTSDGEIYLSAYMGAPELMVGRVDEAPLRSMLESELATQIIDACEERRMERIPKCRACVYKKTCRGGSGVLAYSRFGTWTEPDDYCEARLSLFDAIAEAKAAAAELAV